VRGRGTVQARSGGIHSAKRIAEVEMSLPVNGVVGWHSTTKRTGSVPPNSNRRAA